MLRRHGLELGHALVGLVLDDDAERLRSAARRGSEDVAWKEVDPNLPKSPWWYTEDPALGVGMRIVRPFTAPDKTTQLKWWEPDKIGRAHV